MSTTTTQSRPASAQPMGFPGRGPGAFGSGAKAKDFRTSISKLAKYLLSYKIAFTAVFIFAIASTIFSIVSPKILGNITNQIVDDYIDTTIYDQIIGKLPSGVTLPAGTTGATVLERIPQSELQNIPADQLERIKALDLSVRPAIDFDGIAQIALFLVGLYILSACFNYLQAWLMSRVAQNVTFKLRGEVSQKINRLPLKYFDTTTTGDVLSRMTNDIDSISQTLNQSLAQIITSFTSIIGILVMMLSISWELTIVALLILPISFTFIGLVIRNSQKLFSQQQASLGKINGHIEETYAGHNIVKAYNGEAAAISKFDEINAELYDSGWKSQFLSGLMMPIMNFIGNLGYVATAVIGAWLAINGKIKIGDIQAFIQYLQQFNQPIAQAANTTNILQSTAAAAERVFEFLEADEEVVESDKPQKVTDIKGHVQFDHVVFGYDPDKTIIKDLSVEAKPGQRVAIVGPTGAGKTTIVNLLMRFYDVNSGKITIDGINIRDMQRADLRKLFGMVLQDTWLFNGTIRDNIAYGNTNASEQELIAAAQAAQVDHFVHSLPGGYDMVLNETTDNISQGEKQLLTIARAMLANPPILILDEATSSVDTRTEVLIQKAMDKLMEGRTSFVIAHRLSTIKNADLILVMNQGNIVEQGSHEALMKLNGFYAGLYNSQFED